jgi:hypothetical protein
VEAEAQRGECASQNISKLPRCASAYYGSCSLSFCEDQAGAHFKLHLNFPALLRETTFVAIFSLLEDTIVDLARYVGRRVGSKKRLDDHRDRGILAAKKYLDECCGVGFPTQEHPWQEILRYKHIRELIVHSGRCLKRSSHAKAIRNYCRGKRGLLAIDEYDCLELSSAFCNTALSIVQGFLGSVFELAGTRLRQIDGKR